MLLGRLMCTPCQASCALHHLSTEGSVVVIGWWVPVDCRACGVWGIGSHGLVSVEYKTLAAIEWRESQT